VVINCDVDFTKHDWILVPIAQDCTLGSIPGSLFPKSSTAPKMVGNQEEVPGELLSCAGVAEGPGALAEEMDHLEKKLYAKYSKAPPHIGHAPAVNAPVEQTGSRAGGAGEELLVENNPSVGAVRVCITCGGVGKRYENMLMSDLRGEGATRVIESSCSGCKGTGVIEAAKVRPCSSPFSHRRTKRCYSNQLPPSSTFLLSSCRSFPSWAVRATSARIQEFPVLTAEVFSGTRRRARGSWTAWRAGGIDWRGGVRTPR